MKTTLPIQIFENLMERVQPQKIENKKPKNLSSPPTFLEWDQFSKKDLFFHSGRIKELESVLLDPHP